MQDRPLFSPDHHNTTQSLQHFSIFLLKHFQSLHQFPTFDSFTMFAKSFFASALLATGALAAPTISNSAPAELEKRADWQEGKCENHIFVDGTSAIISFMQTLVTNIKPQSAATLSPALTCTGPAASSTTPETGSEASRTARTRLRRTDGPTPPRAPSSTLPDSRMDVAPHRILSLSTIANRSGTAKTATSIPSWTRIAMKVERTSTTTGASLTARLVDALHGNGAS